MWYSFQFHHFFHHVLLLLRLSALDHLQSDVLSLRPAGASFGWGSTENQRLVKARVCLGPWCPGHWPHSCPLPSIARNACHARLRFTHVECTHHPWFSSCSAECYKARHGSTARDLLWDFQLGQTTNFAKQTCHGLRLWQVHCIATHITLW